MSLKAVENLRKRKPTGGRRVAYRGRRAYELDEYPAETLLGGTKIVKKRVRGGNVKLVLRSISHANLYDPSAKKVTKVKIIRVAKNPANRDYNRRGIITKGAIIETEAGRAKVTSRPGQDGVVNAVAIK